MYFDIYMSINFGSMPPENGHVSSDIPSMKGTYKWYPCQGHLFRTHPAVLLLVIGMRAWFNLTPSELSYQ